MNTTASVKAAVCAHSAARPASASARPRAARQTPPAPAVPSKALGHQMRAGLRAALMGRPAASAARSHYGDSSRRGSLAVKASVEVVGTPAPDADSKGHKVAFVAGATGRTGIRVVRELVARGFEVRAGVRDVAKAEKIFKGEDVPAGVGYTGEKDTPAAPLDPLAVKPVACDVEDVASLKTAMAGASVVVSCIGAPESKPLDASLPRRIDGEGGKNLVLAAKEVGVDQFVMVSSLGTGKFGWPASVLNLFWNVLDWKREAELELIGSGLPFTIVRPGGMERPTDDYKLEHNTNMYPADTQFGGQISRLQVAEICAEAVCAPEAAANKVLEVVAEEGAPVMPLADIMRKVDALDVGGPAPVPGSAEYYQRKYQAAPVSSTAKWFDIMGFAGFAPEAVNGRLAMLGALGVLGGELMGQGNVAAQLEANGVFAGVMAAVIIAISLVPFSKGVEAKDAQAGPFNPVAEAANGRLAMLALAVVLYVEHSTGGLFVDIVRKALPF